MQNITVEGTLRNFWKVDGGNIAEYDTEYYGKGLVFFIPNGEVLTSQVENRRERSYMPVEYVSKTGKDFKWNKYKSDTKPQKEIVNSFVINYRKYLREGRGLYIYSNTKGSGKTMLACCIANEVIKRNPVSVKFTSAIEYIELVKEKSDSAYQKKSEIMDATILIIDDIGATMEDKEWIQNSIFRLVDRRYTGNLTTIFTSNVPIQKLKCGDRVISRIESMSTPVLMPEESIRSVMAKKKTDEFMRRVIEESKEENVEWGD